MPVREPVASTRNGMNERDQVVDFPAQYESAKDKDAVINAARMTFFMIRPFTGIEVIQSLRCHSGLRSRKL